MSKTKFCGYAWASLTMNDLSKCTSLLLTIIHPAFANIFSLVMVQNDITDILSRENMENMLLVDVVSYELVRYFVKI